MTFTEIKRQIALQTQQKIKRMKDNIDILDHLLKSGNAVIVNFDQIADNTICVFNRSHIGFNLFAVPIANNVPLFQDIPGSMSHYAGTTGFMARCSGFMARCSFKQKTYDSMISAASLTGKAW